MPIAPGAHALDLISDAYVYGRRISVTIQAGQTERVTLDLRDELPFVADGFAGRMPTLAGGSWYQGATGGRPLFSNISDVSSVPAPAGGAGASGAPRPVEIERPGPPLAPSTVALSTVSEVGAYLPPAPPGYRSRPTRLRF
jgi:hypothetical protein